MAIIIICNVALAMQFRQHFIHQIFPNAYSSFWTIQYILSMVIFIGCLGSVLVLWDARVFFSNKLCIDI